MVTMLQQFDDAGRRTRAAAIGAIDDFVNDYEYDDLGRMIGLTQQDQAGGNAVADKRVEFFGSTKGPILPLNRV